MFRKLLFLASVGILLSGCYMVPLAMVGPATSGFSSTSIVQSSLTTTMNYLVKKGTGKTIGEYAYDIVSSDILEQTYFPKDGNNTTTLIESKPRPIE